MENEELVGSMPELLQRAYTYLRDKARGDVSNFGAKMLENTPALQPGKGPFPSAQQPAVDPAADRPPARYDFAPAPSGARIPAGEVWRKGMSENPSGGGSLTDIMNMADRVLRAPTNIVGGAMDAGVGRVRDAISNAIASALNARRTNPDAAATEGMDRLQRGLNDVAPNARFGSQLPPVRDAIVGALGWQPANAPQTALAAPGGYGLGDYETDPRVQAGPRQPGRPAATPAPRTAFSAQTTQPATGPRGMTPEQVAQNKPRINNADGSVSTERTITIEADGKHYNIPTIVNGKQLTPDEAVAAWRAGKNKEVGVYDTQDEATAAARQRSDDIGKAIGATGANPVERAMEVVKGPSMADKFRERSAAIDRSPTGGLSDAQKGQALMEAGLAIMRAASKPGGSMLGAVGEGGQHGTALAREFDKVNRETDLRRRTEAREDLRTEMQLGQHDEDRELRREDLLERRADRRDRTRIEGQRLDLLREQIEQGKYKVQDTNDGFVLVDAKTGNTRELIGPDGKRLKAYRKPEDTRPAEVRLLEYLKNDPAAREIYMGTKQRENAMGEKDIVAQAVNLVKDSSISGKPIGIDEAVRQVLAGRDSARTAMGKGTNPPPGEQLPKGVPAGSKLIGTSGGKPVYQTPEGKRLLVEGQ